HNTPVPLLPKTRRESGPYRHANATPYRQPAHDTGNILAVVRPSRPSKAHAHLPMPARTPRRVSGIHTHVFQLVAQLRQVEELLAMMQYAKMPARTSSEPRILPGAIPTISWCRALGVPRSRLFKAGAQTVCGLKTNGCANHRGGMHVSHKRETGTFADTRR